jgi:hypothetical protein
MTDLKSTIELPRLEGERAERYEARTLYITMGASRSLEAVRQKIGKRSARRLEEWSREDGWVSLAADYDQTVYTLAAQAKADEYRQKIEAHREKAEQAGDALFTVAGQLIKAVNQALAGPRKIKGEDGKVYTVHAIELNANTFSIAAKAMQVALDLKAHSLGIERLIPLLDDDSE